MIANASAMLPITPHGNTNAQISHAGKPAGGVQPRTIPTILAIAAPIIPPAKKPGIANAHPIA